MTISQANVKGGYLSLTSKGRPAIYEPQPWPPFWTEEQWSFPVVCISTLSSHQLS